MKEKTRRVIRENRLGLVAIIFLISVTGPLFGVSQSLPDGAFTGILALLFFIMAILFYWAEGESDDQLAYK